MRKLAAEKADKGSPPVVISQCSVEEGECTHYIPLTKGLAFHAGLPSAEEHLKANPEPFFDPVGAIKGGLRVIFPFLKPYIDTDAKTSSANEAEL